jgi:hypothetical protein
MRRSISETFLARLGLASVAAATAFAAGSSPATASAQCPNEAVRAQQADTAFLPDCRGYELVTPVNKDNEEATVPKAQTGVEIPYQASEAGPQSTFAMTGGIPGSESAGAFIDGISTATTQGSLWTDLSLAPETRFAPIGTVGARAAGQWVYYSPSLSCGVIKTTLPLANERSDPAPELAEGENAEEELDRLYKWTAPAGGVPSESAHGSYKLVTSEKPHDPTGSPYSGGGYRVDGASSNCEHLTFETDGPGYELPVDPPTNMEYAPNGSIYEWTPATGPRVASMLPGDEKEAEKPATLVAEFAAGDKSSNLNEMSADGSRLFFSAVSDEAAAAGEAGFEQVFMRVKGETTVQVSASDTTTPDNGARFVAASRDGSRVFFLANYGLTEHSSSGPEAPKACVLAKSSATRGQGCDLYEYSVATGKLTDLSADTADAKGASARGILGLSSDGSYVYFSASGQLVAGQGNSGSVNETNHEASVYAYREGHISYVATITELEAGGGSPTASEDEFDSVSGSIGLAYLVARVSPNGQYMILATKKQLTSYENIDPRTKEAAPEIYEYAYKPPEAGAGSVTCVSCSQAGSPPISSPRATGQPFSPLGPYVENRGEAAIPRNLLNDGRVFFDSYTPMVTQNPATTETVHVYEFKPNGYGSGECTSPLGCISLLDPGTSTFPSYLEGASEDGANVFFTTAQSLAAQDEDHGLRDLYDVRVGGGILAATPAQRCSSELDTCQEEGEHFNQAPVTSTGPGNEPPLTLVKPPTQAPVIGPVKIVSHTAKGSILSVNLSLPAAGTLTVSGSGLVTVHHSLTRAGVYKLTLTLTSKSKATLRKHKHLKLSVHVSFKASAGPSSTAALSATLK